MTQPRRQAVRIDVNAEIAVHLPDVRRDLQLMLVDISEAGARLQTPLKLPANARLAFTWVGPSRERISISGQIVAASPTSSRTIDYGMAFSMPAAERDKLARDLAELQRRRAFRTGKPAPETKGRERRRHYRASLRFPIHVRAKKEGRAQSFRGDAHDISTGGMLAALPGSHDDGTELQITFTLPLGAVDLGGEEKVHVEQTPFGPRKVKKPAPVRAFEPIDAKARILHKRGDHSGASLYGITFDDFSPFLQEEIARFVHAHQLTQLRKGGAKGE